MDTATGISILVAFSLLPPLVYLLWIRRLERYGREPFGALAGAFLYGGTTGIFIALLLSRLFDVTFQGTTAPIGLSATVLAVLVVAPFTEEFAKGIGMGWVRRMLREPEDGLIYGSAVGLGFAATENLFYGVAAAAEGTLTHAVTTILVRVGSSMLLHAGASALLGFGYGLVVLRGRIAMDALPFYFVAVLLHTTYNGLLLFGPGWGLFAAIGMVMGVAMFVRRRIVQLDRLPHQML